MLFIESSNCHELEQVVLPSALLCPSQPGDADNGSPWTSLKTLNALLDGPVRLSCDITEISSVVGNNYRR